MLLQGENGFFGPFLPPYAALVNLDEMDGMDQISLFWPVLIQNSRVALLFATVALGFAIYAAKRRVERLKMLAVAAQLRDMTRV